MILLLDAHALLWALVDDGTLRRPARDAVASAANDVLVSAATIWEIAIKRQVGKLEAPADLAGAIVASRFVGLPITLVDAETAGSLPLHHSDPFDRMVVAQARRISAVVVTRDAAFGPYGIETILA